MTTILTNDKRWTINEGINLNQGRDFSDLWAWNIYWYAFIDNKDFLSVSFSGGKTFISRGWAFVKYNKSNEPFTWDNNDEWHWMKCELTANTIWQTLSWIWYLYIEVVAWLTDTGSTTFDGKDYFDIKFSTTIPTVGPHIWLLYQINATTGTTITDYRKYRVAKYESIDIEWNLQVWWDTNIDWNLHVWWDTDIDGDLNVDGNITNQGLSIFDIAKAASLDWVLMQQTQPWWPSTVYFYNNIYRANYRGDTVGTWGNLWTSVTNTWVWCWFDANSIFVSKNQLIEKYDLIWNKIWELVVTQNGGIIKGKKWGGFFFTENKSEKISTWLVSAWSIWLPLWDISPSGLVGISYDTTNFFSTWNALIRSFNTSDLSTINTYTLSLTWFPSNNILIWVTLINDTEAVIYYGEWWNGFVTLLARKINIVTNSVIVTTGSLWNSQNVGTNIQYSPIDNKIYITRNQNSWFALENRLYTIDINLVTLTWVFLSNTISNVLYRTSDNSIGFQYSTSWTDQFHKFIVKWVEKTWDTIDVSNEVTKSQATYISF